MFSIKSALEQINPFRFFKGQNTSSFSSFEANEVPMITHGSPVLEDSSVAAKAVDKVASAVMNAEPICMAGDNVIKNTTTDKLIKSPNVKYSGQEMVYKIVEDIYIGNFAVLALVGNVNAKATEMWRVNPAKVTLRRNTYFNIYAIFIANDVFGGEYYYDEATGRFLSTANPFVEIFLIRYPTKSSILNTCRYEIEILSLSLSRNGALIKNGGRLSTLFTFNGRVSQDEMLSRTQSLERATRSKAYGGIICLSGGEDGIDVKEMGLSPRDMDFKSLQEFCRREVYFRCGVMTALVEAKASTHDNVAKAIEQFYMETVIPMGDLIYSTIGKRIARREKQDYTCVIDQTKIQSIRTRQLAEMVARSEVGIYSVNELRALDSFEKVKDGDVVLVANSKIPLDKLMQEPAPTTTSSDAKPLPIPKD